MQINNIALIVGGIVVAVLIVYVMRRTLCSV